MDPSWIRCIPNNRVGVAQAIAIEEQVRAYGGPQFQLVQQVMSRFAEAIETAKVEVVPRVQMNGAQGGGSLIENLLGLLLSEKAAALAGSPAEGPRDPAAERLREEIRGKLRPAGGKPGA